MANSEDIDVAAHEHAPDSMGSSPSRRLEIVSAIIAVVISTTLIVGARAIQLRAEGSGIDPRFWPTVLGILGLILGLSQLLLALRRDPESREDIEPQTRDGRTILALAVSSTVLFLIAWNFVPFVAVAPVYAFVLLYSFGARGWKTLIIFPVAMTLFIYLLFNLTLRVPL